MKTKAEELAEKLGDDGQQLETAEAEIAAYEQRQASLEQK